MLNHQAQVLTFAALAALLLGAAAAARERLTGRDTAQPDGAALYGARCAACHDHPAERIPSRIMLSTYRTPEEIIAALTNGVMRQQAAGLSADEIRAARRVPDGQATDRRPIRPDGQRLHAARAAATGCGRLEWLGPRSREHAPAAAGRPGGERRAASRAQVGVRVPGSVGLRPTRRRRRPALRRRYRWSRVLARRAHRLHALVLRRGRTRPHGNARRAARGHVARALCGVFRRRQRQRARSRCRNRHAPVERARRCAPGRPDPRHAAVLPGTPVRPGQFG